MLENYFADDLLENQTLSTGLHLLAAFAEDPPLQFVVGLGIDHVDLGQQGVEVGEVVYLLQVQDDLLPLGGSLSRERLYR
jgi:hypothetical protein